MFVFSEESTKSYFAPDDKTRDEAGRLRLDTG